MSQHRLTELERDAERDDGMRTCPECRGAGYPFPLIDMACDYCDGTGTIEDDGSDEFDRRCDEAHERQIDREAEQCA